MRKSVFVLAAGVALSVGLVQAGSAADLPVYKAPAPAAVVAPYDWTGIYVGLVGGWGLSSQRWSSTAGVTTGNFTGDGGLVGGTIGANWQSGNFVIGVEADGAWSGIKAVNTTTGGCAAVAPCTAHVNWLSTVRGRAGAAFDNVLLYLTGGLAIASIHSEQLLFSPLATATSTKAGWTGGAGVEVGIGGNWSAKLEYLYTHFGQTPFCPAAGCGAVVVSDYTNLHILRAGLNYRFGSPR